jgi:hypothetical protein
MDVGVICDGQTWDIGLARISPVGQSAGQGRPIHCFTGVHSVTPSALPVPCRLRPQCTMRFYREWTGLLVFLSRSLPYEIIHMGGGISLRILRTDDSRVNSIVFMSVQRQSM